MSREDTLPSGIYPNEPGSYWLPDDLDKLLVWAVEQKASDITLLPGRAPGCRINGAWVEVAKRPVSADEIMGLVDSLARSPAASARLKGAEDIDFAHEVRVDRQTRHRFRVNATACRDGWGTGANLVLRTIPAHPPDLDDLGVQADLVRHLFPQNGLVLVTGVMGSGKSTLLSATLRRIIEQDQRMVLTYEAPIEFDLMTLPLARSFVVQSEIPGQLRDFARAPRNAARRAADVILVGESRDKETLRSMIEAAEIGVAAYSTVHTRSVADTLSRIINVFPIDEQPGIAATLISAIRLIIQQRLVPKADGTGRTALIEYLAFGESERRQLMGEPPRTLSLATQRLIEDKGNDLLTVARRMFDAGVISQDTFRPIESERTVDESR